MIKFVSYNGFKIREAIEGSEEKVEKLSLAYRSEFVWIHGGQGSNNKFNTIKI